MDESESSEEEFFIASVADSSSSKGWYVELPVNGHNVKFKIDSGADVSVVSLETYNNLPDVPRLRPAKHKLVGVNGTL